jgi:hypothetical protein
VRQHWKIALPVAAAVSLLMTWIAFRAPAESTPPSPEMIPVAQAPKKPPQPVPNPPKMQEEKENKAKETSAAKAEAPPPPPRVATVKKSVAPKPAPAPPIVANLKSEPRTVPPVKDKEKVDDSIITGSDEVVLLRELQSIPEVGIDVSFKAAVLYEKSGTKSRDHAGYIASLKSHKLALTGLPFIEKDCQLPADRAALFGATARGLRSQLQLLSRFAPYTQYDFQNELERRYHEKPAATMPDTEKQKFKKYLFEARHDLDDDSKFSPTVAAAAMRQLMMAENRNLRGLLVVVLEEIEGKEITQELARRALFDLETGTRQAALQALKQRRSADYVNILLEGLRYPYPTIARNAAEALVYLQKQDVVSQLTDMLDAPEPDAPFLEDGQWKVRELVRINHHRNCLLCHPPSDNTRDPVRVTVPSPDRPLPGPFSVEYYSRNNGSQFVRADITYLRQDFSTYQEVDDPGKKWPKQQRYDFFVRVRELTADEMIARPLQAESAEYRKPILFALRELTGVDAGEESSAWRQWLACSTIPQVKKGLR